MNKLNIKDYMELLKDRIEACEVTLHYAEEQQLIPYEIEIYTNRLQASKNKLKHFLNNKKDE